MKTKILMGLMLCAGVFMGTVQANDKVSSTYNAATYQKVCKGKSQGDMVSFAYKGIIWNGTCEQRFFPSNSKGLTGDEPELATACTADNTVKSTTLNGTEVKGKCALSFTPPSPKS